MVKRKMTVSIRAGTGIPNALVANANTL